jgi:hypothetical protein
LDDNKKPGQRDISDLKARLGLKKTQASMPAQSPQGGTPPVGQPAIPPPTGGGQQAERPIPSPFGQPAPQAAPEPAPAPPPDPRRDPFAQQQAANLAAFYGIGQTLPGDASAVGAGDAAAAKPKSKTGLIMGLLVVAVGFGVGNACGRVSSGRQEFNKATEQAAYIRDEVDRLGKQLNSITDLLNTPATLKGNIDMEVSKKLGELDLKKPDQDKLFRINFSQLSDVAMQRLFTYYNHTITLYDDLQLHAKKAEADRESLENFVKKGAATENKNYGVITEQQGPLTLAKMVEVGKPVCSDPAKTDCNANELSAFEYRLDSGSAWGKRPVKGKPGEIVMPLQQTPLFKTIAGGGSDVLAVKDYARRIAAIRSLASSLSNEQKEVLADIKKIADRPKIVAF